MFDGILDDLLPEHSIFRRIQRCWWGHGPSVDSTTEQAFRKSCSNTRFSRMFITLDIVLIILPVLLAVALVTLGERKGLGSLQRRLGPDTVGVYGLLQPFADALKLTTKETVIPALASS